MNRNSTPIILLILAIGIYFTFTSGKVDEITAIKNTNAGYQKAINNSSKLMALRDNIKKKVNQIDPKDLDRLEKMVPNNIDNVRLTLDVKSIGLARNLVLKNVKADAPSMNTSALKPASGTNANNRAIPNSSAASNNGEEYDTVTLSFGVTTDYATFLELLKDLETSLRIMDISKISFTANDNGIYDYTVEVKTYWLRQ